MNGLKGLKCSSLPP